MKDVLSLEEVFYERLKADVVAMRSLVVCYAVVLIITDLHD